MKKYIFTVFAVAAVLSSCSKSLELNGDINSGAKAITTIGASTEISTRAVVSSSDNTKVLWQDGDQLGVLGANSSSVARNFAYTLDGDAGSTTGTFKKGDSDITAISAVMYPYQASASWDGTNGGKLTCEIPSVQKATVGSFDKDAAIMYSIGNTINVQLNYAVNFLKVNVTETNVHAISISSATTALSGKMEIASSGVSGASSGSLKAVTLIPATGDFLQTGDYYIAVKAGDIENPTISYVYLDLTNHTATEKTKAGSATLSFASGTNVKLISVNWTGATERKAFQLWADGPYFAEYNVGVTDGKAESYGGYYAWGGSQDKVDDHNTGSSELSHTGDDITDTATKLWGSKWRMPTQTELQGLIDNCDVVSTNVNGKDGREFTGNGAYASNSVFLPAAGYCHDGGDAYNQGAYVYYWSSTPHGSDYACSLIFDSSSQGVDYDYHRDYGYSVRAVLAE